MIRALVRYVIPWRLTGGVNLALAATMALVTAQFGESIGFLHLAMDPILLLSAVLVGQPTRATLFETGLPIAGRTLFLARMLVRLLLLWVPGAVFLASAWMSGGAGVAPILLAILVLLTLCTIVLQCVQPADVTLSGWAFNGVFVAVFAAGAAIWFTLPHAVAFALMILAIVVAWARAWSLVPVAYQVAPLAIGGSPRADDGVTTRIRETASTTRAPWWPLLQPALSRWTASAFAIAILQGISLGQNSFMLLWGLLMLTEFVRRRAQWMRALPVAPRTMLMVMMLGSVVPIWGGTAIGVALRGPIFFSGRIELETHNGPQIKPPGTNFYRTKTAETSVTLELWKRAPNGQAPVIQSPTGETTVPPVISILGVPVYNPYYVGEANSDAFFEWQFERATLATFGHAITRADVRKGGPPAGLPLNERGLTGLLVGAAYLLILLYVVFLLNLYSWHRLVRPSARAMRATVLTLAAAPLLLIEVAEYWYTMKWHAPVLLPALQLLAQRALAVLPENALAVAAIAFLPAAGMCLVLARQIRATDMHMGVVTAPAR